MAVVNHTGALASSTWDLTADEHHITGNCTLNAGSTQTLTPGATPNPIRFDGNFNITSTTSGRITGTGSSTNPIRWQPNGAATTWYEDGTTRYVFNNGTGDWTLSYHDLVGCYFDFGPSAGTNQVDNIRTLHGAFSGTLAYGFIFRPSGGTNTVTDIQSYGCSTAGFRANSVTGGTNVVRRVYVDGGALGFEMSVSGGTNTFSDFKAYHCVRPCSWAGTAAISITNFSAIECQLGIATTPGATSTITRYFVSSATGTANNVWSASPGAAVVLTFDEAYINDSDLHGFVNTAGAGTQARLVVSNSVITNTRKPGELARTAISRGTSSGNDIVMMSYSTGTAFGVELGTSDNDYLVSTGALFGPIPFGVELFADWASSNWTQNVDSDSGNTASTSTPAQYGGPLASNRTNARSTPNKPLTCTTPSAALSGSAGAETATITFTTGIKARSRLLISETSGNTTRALAEIVTPWKYHGILDPEMVDFTLPVTSHSHAFKPQAGKTYYVVAECYDPCGRRFLSAEGSFTSTAATGGGAPRSAFAGAGMRVS